MRTLVLLAVLLVAGCSSLPKLGGTPINTNAQIGKENTQQVVGAQENVAGDKVESAVSSGYVQSVDARTYDPLLVLLLILGWMLPSPAEMWRGINSMFSKGRD